MAGKLRKFWKDLTHHHTYTIETRDIEGYSGGGSSSSNWPIYGEPYDREIREASKLDKIIGWTCLAAIAIGISTCSYNLHKKRELSREMFIPYTHTYHSQVESGKREKQEYKDRIRFMERMTNVRGDWFTLYDDDIERFNDKINEIDEEIKTFEEKIKMKVEKGYLTPDHESWNFYKDKYGDLPWWPKSS